MLDSSGAYSQNRTLTFLGGGKGKKEGKDLGRGSFVGFGGPSTPYLPSLKVDRNPKTVIAISRQFSMIFEFQINELNRFFKAFQMVLTITARNL